jgi:hypothetical protein
MISTEEGTGVIMGTVAKIWNMRMQWKSTVSQPVEVGADER